MAFQVPTSLSWDLLWNCFALIQKVDFSISYKFMQNLQISDYFSLPLAIRHHGLLAGSFGKMSYSLGFPLSLWRNFSSASLQLFSPQSNSHIECASPSKWGPWLRWGTAILHLHTRREIAGCCGGWMLSQWVGGWVDRCPTDTARC